MLNLSLSPRFDLFRFELPKDWFPDELVEKYTYLLNRDTSVVTDPVNYINESIQGINIPGLSDLTIQQNQISRNTFRPSSSSYNTEPYHENSYKNPANPISLIEKEFKVTFRQNQGLYNYFMLYECVFWHICKPQLFDRGEDVFCIDILNDVGEICCKIKLMQPSVSSLDGLEFSYSKAERSDEAFTLSFNFNNIDFDFTKN